MSKQAKFGELALHTLNDLETANDINDGQFSTIDLGSQSLKSPTQTDYDPDNNNNNTKSVGSSSYTSFGDAISSKKPITKPNSLSNGFSSNQSSPKRVIVPSDSNNSLEFNTSKASMNAMNGSNSGPRSITPNSMLSTASEVSSKLATKTASTIENLKLWSKSAYKCTKQIVSEKLGKSSRTIDPELDVIVDVGYFI
jgi:hypothetical protein